MSENFEISSERKEYSTAIGKETENNFIKACESVGYKCYKTDDRRDIYEHIDFIIERSNGTKTSVDVKGANHPLTIWIEFKNVLGYDGWLYGKAELIVFDMPELKGFVIVDRKELIELCDNIVEKVFVSKEEATRKLYTRKGRKDVISRLHLTDLMKLKSYKLLKYAQ